MVFPWPPTSVCLTQCWRVRSPCHGTGGGGGHQRGLSAGVYFRLHALVCARCRCASGLYVVLGECVCGEARLVCGGGAVVWSRANPTAHKYRTLPLWRPLPCQCRRVHGEPFPDHTTFGGPPTSDVGRRDTGPEGSGPPKRCTSVVCHGGGQGPGLGLVAYLPYDGGGGAFLKKLGASFSRDPPPRGGVGVGHWWVSRVPWPYIFQAPKARENCFRCSFPFVVLGVWWVGASLLLLPPPQPHRG